MGLQPLDLRVVSVWRIEAVIESAIALAVGAGASVLLWKLDVLVWLAALPVVAALLYGVIDIGIVPKRKWRSWRYAIGDAEIELRHGIWWQTWTLVPMARIQHVDTRRGPLARRSGEPCRLHRRRFPPHPRIVHRGRGTKSRSHRGAGQCP
jgi:membrane protein YdbS with pleckstrin-like domain